MIEPGDERWEYGKAQAEVLLKEFMRGHTDCCAHITGEIREGDQGEIRLFVIVVALLAGTGIVVEDGEESVTELVAVYQLDPSEDDSEFERIPIDDVHPFVRALARMPVAVANFDMDMAWAIWSALPFEDQIRMTAAVLQIVDSSLEDRLDQRRAGRGLN